MTLTTHALAGGTMAVLFPAAPATAIFLAFASHFVLDCLPHRDYRLRSMEKHPDDPLLNDMPWGADFWHDLWHTALDAILGVSLALLLFSLALFHAPPLLVFFAACAGVLPDFLQFVYFKTRTPLLRPLQRFHIWVNKSERSHVEPWVGMSLQAVLLGVGLVCLKAVV